MHHTAKPNARINLLATMSSLDKRGSASVNGRRSVGLHDAVIFYHHSIKFQAVQMKVHRGFQETASAHTFHSSSSPFPRSTLARQRFSRSVAEAQQFVLTSAVETEMLASRTAEMARAKAAKDTKDAFEAASGIVGEGAVAQSKKLLWERAKKELVRYWDGTKLLGREIRISTRLANRLLHGGRLNRGEQQQLRRTTRDLLRLIPFSVFVIVPFMEFLLPVALKLFPNMLPSTFEDAIAEEEKKGKLLKIRLEVAKSLQKTVEESGAPGTKRAEAMKAFGDLFRNVRATGEQASTEELIRVAKLLHKEMTLDNLSRPQLVSMCRYMNLNAFGTDKLLRYQLRTRMNSIKKDDMLIMAEGVESLTNIELRAACQYRGIRVGGVSTARLRSDLAQWVDLHLVHSIPSPLLILSLVFSFSDTSITSPLTGLSSLPETLLTESELLVSELKGAVTPKQNLDIEELMADGKTQEGGENVRKDLKDMARQGNSSFPNLLGNENGPLSRPTAAMLAASARGNTHGSSVTLDRPISTGDSESTMVCIVEDVEEKACVPDRQLMALREALCVMSSHPMVLKEREDLERPRKEVHKEYIGVTVGPRDSHEVPM